MALKASIKFKSVSPALQKGVGRFINRSVEKSIKVIERNVKVNTPVVHGHLRRSITSVMTGFGKGEVFTNPVAKGVNPVDYAVYVEYGTRYFAPRAMFRKGVDQSTKRIQDIFAEESSKLKVEIKD